MTNEIKDMSVSKEIDMSEMGTVRGGYNATDFGIDANYGYFNNAWDVINKASLVVLTNDPHDSDDYVGPSPE
jgi:hypothetical protein